MKKGFRICIILIIALGAILSFPGCVQKEKPADGNDDEPTYPDQIEGDPDPVHETHDLTIGWIQRLPKINYVWKSQQPAVDGWPAEGQQVTWRAFVKNWSNEEKTGVGYQWKLDDQIVESGSLNIPPRSYVSTDYLWNWSFERHTLDFMVEPDQGDKNHLSIYTDSISLGLYVEDSVYDHFHEHQHELEIGSNSFEGWAQRQMRMWHEILRTAVYDETPEGVKDRIRIDCITIVPDNSLPLSDNYIGLVDFDPLQAVPDINDRSVDMQWGFPVTVLSVYSNYTSVELYNQFFYSGFLQHELGHARYLIDVYGFDVYHCPDGYRIDIMEDGELVAGSMYMPGDNANSNGVNVLKVHETEEKGMMGTDWTFLDRYSAVCMNLVTGQRAVSGNYNAPENIGVFLNDLPQQNRFTIMNNGNELLKNASVEIYQSSRPGSAKTIYSKYFDNIPDLILTTDDQGKVLLGRCPFSNNGQIHHREEYSNVAFIMRVERSGKVGYKIIDISSFNHNYWAGNTQMADYSIKVKMR